MDYLSFPFSSTERLRQNRVTLSANSEHENKTSLVTDEMKDYLFNVLKHCHENHIQMYSRIWNTVVIITFVVVVGSVLYYCYTTKPTPEQIHKRRMRTKKLVLEKMKEMNEMNMYTQPNGITFLPVIQNKGY